MNNSENVTKVNIKDLKRVLRHVISNNIQLQTLGITPLAINVEGESGLGKTSAIRQVANEFGFTKQNIVKQNLASFEEIGDILGTIVTEYKMGILSDTNKGKEILKPTWVKEPAIPTYEKLGYSVLNESRMAYSVPAWIAGKKGPGVLILDDYNRASQRFTQAIMELILTQEYTSWGLPEGWTIILSSNPESGMYNVTDQDPAQKSRALKAYLKWDAECWAEWAEKEKIDSRFINFILLNPEIVSDKTPEINARTITMFSNAIRSIENFGSDEGLEMIKLLGEGSLGNVFSTMFVSFINKKMDKLITIPRMLDLNVPFEQIESELRDNVKTGTEYRGDIAYVLSTRLLNYTSVNYDGPVSKELIERVGKILKSNLLGTDLKYVIGKKITGMENKAFYALLEDIDIVDAIIK